MIHAALRDLVYRRRRYLLSMVGAGLVFAMSLVMTGLSAAFPAEWERTVDMLGARAFVVPSQLSGPFTGTSPFEAQQLPAGTEPLTYAVQTVTATKAVTVGMFGVRRGAASEPRVTSGSPLRRRSDVLVSDRAPFDLGSTVVLAGRRFTVVGRVGQQSTNGGMPTVVVDLADAQDVLFRGLPLVTSGIVRAGAPLPPPTAGFRTQPAPAAITDALRILASASQTIALVKALLWLVAALIVGSVTFLSVIERLRDFAVFKAIGTSTGHIAAGVMLQAVTLSTLSALVGLALGRLITPAFPMPVVISGTAMVLLPALGMTVGLVASLFGLSRALKVEPAVAFGAAA